MLAIIYLKEGDTIGVNKTIKLKRGYYMDKQKCSIKNTEWLFFLPFFIISILAGKLLAFNDTKKSNFVNKSIIGLEWLFCIILIISIIYGIYKLIKKHYTLEKIWLFSGIFILIQFAGVYQFELLMKYYNIGQNNVIFHDIMASEVFWIPYIVFLLYYIIKDKNRKSKNGLTRFNIIVLILLLLLPLFRSINLFIYRYVVEGLQNNKISIISRIVFEEGMRYSEKAQIAEDIMNNLMLINTYIDVLYNSMIFLIICVMGVSLIKGKITYQKYLALAGNFIIIQYLSIIYFDKILNCFDDSFYTANINLLYKIVLNHLQPLVFIIPLLLYLIKKYHKIQREIN
jgi:hypothetical protein